MAAAVAAVNLKRVTLHNAVDVINSKIRLIDSPHSRKHIYVYTRDVTVNTVVDRIRKN
jgi:hypothetical protein